MIGIICAITEERDALAKHMCDAKEVMHYDVPFLEGTIEGKKVVMALSGVGKVNATMAATLMLSTYDIKVLLNVGVAGGLKKTQNVMDMVLASGVVQYDMDTSPIDGPEGVGLRFSCDEKLVSLCEKILQKEQLSYEVGTVASGDCFVTLSNRYDFITETFPDCVCAEMEGGAIAHVATRFKVPCLVVRSLSDVAPKGGSKMSYETFAQKASVVAAEVFTHLIACLSL